MIDTSTTLQTLLECRLIDRENESLINRTLTNHNIITISDLLGVTDPHVYRGVGLEKAGKILDLQKKVRQFVDSDIDLVEYMQRCDVDQIIQLDGIPENILEIPLGWLLSSSKVGEKYDSIIRNTLSGKNIKDILSLDISRLETQRGIGKKKVRDVRELLEDIKSLIEDREQLEDLLTEYIESGKVPVLPSRGNENESYASLIKRFIQEVSEVYREQNEGDIADAIELIYKHGYDQNQVAIRKNKDRETIRLWMTSNQLHHKSFIWGLRNIVSRADETQFYTISEDFRNIMKKIQLLCETTPLKCSLEQLLGADVDDNIINFVLDYVDAKILDGGYTRIKEEFIVVNCDLKHVKDKWQKIFELLVQVVKPISKESIILHIRRKFKSLPSNVENIIMSIIENSNQFVSEHTGIVTTYQLRWDQLKSMQSRVERILYEYKDLMHKTDIESEYMRRLHESGLEKPNSFLIKSSKNILEIYEGGTWVWREYTKETKTITRDKLVRQYAASQQKFRFEEIMEYLQQIIPSVKERTVKTLLTKYCISTIEGYYVDKNSNVNSNDLHKISMDDIVPDLIKIMNKNQEYTYKELSEAYRTEYGISVPDSKIRRTCENTDVFSIISTGVRRVPIKIKINPAWDGSYEVKDKKRGIQAEWKRNVREEIINKLRYSPNYEMKRSELCKYLESFIPKDVKKNGLYKIFNDESIFIVKKTDNGNNATISLDQKVWEEKSKSNLSDNVDNASVCQYGDSDIVLLQKQQHLLRNPFYNMSTKTDDLKNLCSSTKSFVSWNLQRLEEENMSIKDFEEVWEYMLEQMNIYDGGEDNAYYRMLNMLYGYMFGSTTRTDRYYLWVEIRLNFEPYLKKLLILNNYPTIDNEGRDLQLQKLIDLCQRNDFFPKREDKCHISSCIGGMLKKRNYKGHNAENTPNDNIIVQNIQMAIILYLYISMQFRNK